MLKITATALAIAIAGSASAAGWRSLRVDASTEAALEQSLAVFKDKLPDARRYVFGEALKDIWVAGSQAAAAEQREYTAAEYYRQIDGLTYEKIVKLTDPTGDTAKARYRQASLGPASMPNRQADARRASTSFDQRPHLGETPAINLDGQNMRGRTPLTGPGGQ